MTKKKRGYTSMNVTGVRLSNGKEFVIVHTVPMTGTGINDFYTAVQNWKARTNKYTAQSLCDYINSKSHMTGHIAITKEDAINKYGLKF